MEQQRYFITKTGRESVEQNLKKLLSEDRPQIIKAIAEARSHGDLSENAEYHSAKERQGMIEAKISYLKNVLARGEVVDVSLLNGPIKFGATVRLEDEETEEVLTYQLVDEPEADVENGKLNIRTVLGRALIGKDEGDEVTVNAPKGKRNYTVLEVSYS